MRLARALWQGISVSRPEHRLLQAIRDRIDPAALGGRSIVSAGLPREVFVCQPDAHCRGTVRNRLAQLYNLLRQQAEDDGRLQPGSPLIRRWTLSYDIFLPGHGRFVEVDERQHFSKTRLDRLAVQRNRRKAPLYPASFWAQAFKPLVRSPSRDLDPPWRDEARAYRDECREILPVAYGLRPTVRIDVFSLAQATGKEAEMLEDLLFNSISGVQE